MNENTIVFVDFGVSQKETIALDLASTMAGEMRHHVDRASVRARWIKASVAVACLVGVFQMLFGVDWKPYPLVLPTLIWVGGLVVSTLSFAFAEQLEAKALRKYGRIPVTDEQMQVLAALPEGIKCKLRLKLAGTHVLRVCDVVDAFEKFASLQAHLASTPDTPGYRAMMDWTESKADRT